MRALQVIACAGALLFVGSARGVEGTPGASGAASLLARHAALKEELGNNRFNRPLQVVSSESADGVAGEIHALLDHPFAIAAAALSTPAQWCDVLSLHLNTKYCRPSTDGRGTLLHVRIGKKHDQPADEAYRVDFVHRLVTSSANYLQVKMDAGEGPLGTRDYRIVLEAAPVGGRTFIRLSYSYTYGGMARLAMQTYLGTLARGKVGFTVAGTDSGGEPKYVGGMRGVVERNTMRYYLAIEAHLGALSAPAPSRAEKSRRDWFAATETYSRQLHEIEQGAYLEMKRKEHSRQQLEVMGATDPATERGRRPGAAPGRRRGEPTRRPGPHRRLRRA